MKKLLKVLLASILTVVTAVMLLACAPADLDKAQEKMIDLGYNASIGDDYGLIEGCTGYIFIDDKEGPLDFDFDTLTAYLFEDKDLAKAYFDKNYATDDDAYLKGKWVIVGDDDIYKDFVKIHL